MVRVPMTWTTMELLPLVCLCVLTWSGSTSADGNGKYVVVKEGEDAILPCSLSTTENIELKLFDWKKDGQKDVFMYNAGVHSNKGQSAAQDAQFRGRVFHFPDQLKVGNASILIKQTKVTDRGNYTCIFPNLQPRRQFHIILVVGAVPEPPFRILGHKNNGMQLQCEVRDAFPKPHLQLQDSAGKIIPAEEPQVTVRGRSYDILLQTTVTKTDHYRCVVTQKEINHRVSTETYVTVPGSGSPNGVGDPRTGWVVGVVVVVLVAIGV